MSNHIHITPEELYDNYEYKVTVKALKREFPFIKQVRIREDQINKYGLIFLELGIDPYEMAQMFNLTPNKYVIDSILNGNDTFDVPTTTPSLFVGEGYSEIKPIIDGVENLIDEIHYSKAIPDTMKLIGNRKLAPSTYYVDKDNTKVPESPDSSTTI